ncbi:MAG: hypothetical protein LBC97_00540 [Bifidobacteriaceae bacterium]|jgi:hypothetical protein|nr:hypothetical protein [Bifidobacteriaceae bacterium]
MQVVEADRIGHRMIGRHPRIRATAIQACRERQRAAGEATMTALGDLFNRAGQLD